MPETGPEENTPEEAAVAETPARPSTEAPATSAVSRTPHRVSSAPKWPSALALLLAVAALAVAIYSLVDRPAKEPEPTASSSGDSKAQVCGAMDTVTKAVQLQTHANLGPDPTAQQAVAANARLALIGGAQFLLSKVDDGTPQDLADATRAFAGSLQEIGMSALAGQPTNDPTQAKRVADGEAARNKLVELCK
jgi:anti-sigma-K factor RskA